jgi:2-methylisocitrate lyase-like PEP mutase family enzyme
MTSLTRLQERIASGKLLVAPGVYDALTAKLAAGVGFEALYMTGYGTSASRHGLPDRGFLTMTEMLDNVRAITNAVEIPLIADADTGYGNALNVVRTVREYERAGAAAIHIEDQVWPKRCGHMTGKQVIPQAEMVSKLRAAVDQRPREDFLIIARTDALAVEGWEATLGRAQAYLEAGADVLFVEALETVEQMERVPKLFDAPCLINMAPRTPNRPVEELEKMGYAIAIYPGICLLATVKANVEALKEFRETGCGPDLGELLPAFLEFNEFLGTARYDELETRYKVD